MPSSGLTPTRRTIFESEAAWPFTLRKRELAECIEYLSGTSSPRVLRIFGSSGSGKSFFVRELLSRYTVSQPDGVALYIDIPPSDFEATKLFDQINILLARPRQP